MSPAPRTGSNREKLALRARLCREGKGGEEPAESTADGRGRTGDALKPDPPGGKPDCRAESRSEATDTERGFEQRGSPADSEAERSGGLEAAAEGGV